MADDDLPTGSFGAVLRELAAAPATAPRAPIDPGTVVGDTLEVVRRLGAGGMGTVYLVRDRALGREVAIKVHSAVHAEEATLREAQVMAKVRHPNVVTVYEVGEHAGRVYVAMEYLAGGTLAEWLAAEPRAWREIVARFVAAGRGLAAAHAAGVVHRDFKPTNVLIGDDGRICVSDFGLAHDADGADVTAGGGTPRFMAPEQRAGAAGDARADQYGFGVALGDALVKAGPPAWLRAIVARATEAGPDARWPSLTALLDRIERGLGRGRRAAIAAGVGATGLVAIAAVVVLARSAAGPVGPSPCAAAGDRLAGAWDPDRRAAVERAIVASGHPFAGDVFARVAGQLDGYATRWSAARIDACEATEVRHEQSADALDRRMGCLDEQRGRLRAAVELFAGPIAADQLDDAVTLAGRLEDPAGCGRKEIVEGGIAPPPTEPALRARYDANLATIDDVDARAIAGRWREALALGEPALAEARAIGHPVPITRALFALGIAHQSAGHTAEAEQALAESARFAADARDDRRSAQIWSVMVFLLAEQHARLDDAERMLPVAEAALARADHEPVLEAQLHNARARLATGRGDLEGALREYQLTLALHQQGALAHQIAGANYNVGNILARLGRTDEALVHLERALALRRETYGPQSTLVAMAIGGIGAVLGGTGRLDEAAARYTAGLAMLQEVLGPDHPMIATAHYNLAEIDLARGRDADARAASTRALALRRTLLPAGHTEIGQSLEQLGKLELEAGHHAQAEALLNDALALYTQTLGPEHPEIASIEFYLGTLAMATDQLTTAEAHLRRARAVMVATVGEAHGFVASVDGNLAVILDKRGRRAEAIAAYQRSLAIFERVFGPDHYETATALFNYGRMLSTIGRHREARPLLLRSLAISEKAFGPDHETVGEVLDILSETDRALGHRAEAAAEAARARKILHATE